MVNGKEDRETSGIDLSGLKPLILPIGIVVVGYYFLKSQGIISPTYPPSTNITPACPRGTEYAPEIFNWFFGTCDPGYMWDWSGTHCHCIDAASLEAGTSTEEVKSLKNWKPLTLAERKYLLGR